MSKPSSPAAAKTGLSGLKACALAAATVGLVAVSGLSQPAQAQEGLRMLGWLEKVQFAEGGIVLEAKLDSGADNSSLHAEDYETFEKDGEEWVRFEVEGTDGRTATFERPVTRWASIVGRDNDRPVIELGFCIADVYREVEINLADRSHLDYPMLVGRSYLRDHVILNSGDEFTFEPTCEEVMQK